MKNRTRATRQVGHQNSIRLSIFFLTGDRKSTRLNSSHSQISYAVFCLKKKKKTISYCSGDVQILTYITLPEKLGCSAKRVSRETQSAANRAGVDRAVVHVIQHAAHGD